MRIFIIIRTLWCWVLGPELVSCMAWLASYVRSYLCRGMAPDAYLPAMVGVCPEYARAGTRRKRERKKLAKFLEDNMPVFTAHRRAYLNCRCAFALLGVLLVSTAATAGAAPVPFVPPAVTAIGRTALQSAAAVASIGQSAHPSVAYFGHAPPSTIAPLGITAPPEPPKPPYSVCFPPRYEPAPYNKSFTKDPEYGWIYGGHRQFTEEHWSTLKQRLVDRKKSFAFSKEELGCYHGAEGPFEIKLTTEKPVIQRQRRTSPAAKLAITKHLEPLIKTGIVVPAGSEVKGICNPSWHLSMTRMATPCSPALPTTSETSTHTLR